MSTTALLVVDVQRDFVEGGSLGVEGGIHVARLVTEHIAGHGPGYAAVVASRDWHEPHGTNGGHFATEGEEPDFATTWPVHCVSTGGGADYAPGFDTTGVTHHVRKGVGEPAYSAFEGLTHDGERLAVLLRELGVTAVDVAGIATDHCVRATVLDARREGFAVRLLPGMHVGVAPGTSRAALAEMAAAGAEVAE